jgi:CO/xanthine dehydrogenase FAD-binding subunit
MINSHPGLPEFDYVKPASLKEASQFLSQHVGEARPFMGGTDIIVRMRDGFYQEKFLVDVKGLDGTDKITFDPKKGLTIGAAVTMNMVATHPDIKKHFGVLADAAQSVASYQLRNRATVIGNICNASPAGDSIGACIVLGGVLKVHGVDGVRDEPLNTFFKGPGKTVLKAGDIVTSIFLPLPPEKAAGKYIKLGRNVISDLSIVGVTVYGYADAKAKSGYTFKLALASVAPVPFVPVASEKILAEKTLTDDVIQEAAVAAMDAVTPIDDVRGSAQYRKLMVRNLVRQGITAVLNQLKK